MVSIRTLAATACLLVPATAFAEDPLPRASPEQAGFSSERLARIDAVLKADIEPGVFPAPSSLSLATASS